MLEASQQRTVDLTAVGGDRVAAEDVDGALPTGRAEGGRASGVAADVVDRRRDAGLEGLGVVGVVVDGSPVRPSSTTSGMPPTSLATTSRCCRPSPRG